LYLMAREGMVRRIVPGAMVFMLKRQTQSPDWVPRGRSLGRGLMRELGGVLWYSGGFGGGGKVVGAAEWGRKGKKNYSLNVRLKYPSSPFHDEE